MLDKQNLERSRPQEISAERLAELEYFVWALFCGEGFKSHTVRHSKREVINDALFKYDCADEKELEKMGYIARKIKVTLVTRAGAGKQNEAEGKAATCQNLRDEAGLSQ